MGLLDEPLREIAQTLTDTFSDVPRRFQMRQSNYDPRIGEGSVINSEALIKTPPPSTIKQSETTENVYTGDLRLMVPALSAEQAEFDMVPQDGASLYVQIGCHDYKVVWSQEIWAGDQVVAYILHLRR